MKDPRETAIRYLTMLSLIPPAPGKIAITTLQAKLADRGFEINLRSLQRDLTDNLSAHFSLICDDSQRPYRWSFSENAFLNLPSMDTPSALAYFLAEEQLRSLLPQSVADQLKPQFNSAKKFLANLTENGLADWTKKVRAIPNGKALFPAAINGEVWRNTTEALLQGKQLNVIYASRETGKKRAFQLHPAGLVTRYSVSYLVARMEGFDDLRHYALHRIHQAEVLDDQKAQIDGYHRLNTLTCAFINSITLAFPNRNNRYNNSLIEDLIHQPIARAS
ncbi:MAG: hypothetical protein RL217_713 [Pseudomonadota bacterium]|jgi:hypothetical protein